MIESPGNDDTDQEEPLSRRTVIALVGFLILLPVATAIVVVVALTHSTSDSELPPLKIGSCVEVSGPNHDVTDVECPAGNGRVVSVGTSTLQCPATADWGVIRNAHIYCVQRTAADPTSP